MNGMHVHVERIRFEYAADHLFRFEYRNGTQHIPRVENQCVGCDAFEHGDVGVELRRLAGCRDKHCATRRHQRMAGEPIRRFLQKGTTSHGQPPDLRRAVAFHEQRGRPPGRVIAGVRLALQQQHAASLRQPVASRGRGDTGADHDEVGAIRIR